MESSIQNIIDFIIDFKNPKNKQGLDELYSIFKSIYYKSNLFNEDLDELFNEFLTQKIIIGSSLKKACESKDKDINKGYLITSIKNFINTYFNSKPNLKSLEQTNLENEEFNIIETQDICFNEYLQPYFKIVLNDILFYVKDYFDEKELRDLCNYFLSDIDNKNLFYEKELSDDARYKRNQRIKLKLQEFIEKNSFEYEPFEFFIKNIFPSEICDQFGSN